MKFINLSTGFMVGNPWTGSGPDAIYKTTNGGLNWMNIIITNAVVGAFSVDFADENTGYICGWVGIMKTTNAGSNWYLLNRFTSYALFDIDFTSVNTGYAVGGFGTIIKTTTGGGSFIGIKPVSNSVPDNFYLYQNYPNPFNPVTKIKFDVPAPLSFGEGPVDDSKSRQTRGGVRLVIYDLLGREIVTLVNGQLKPGTYEVTFDGKNFSSGVYFYRLSAVDPVSGTGQDFTDVKKMILVK